MRKFLILSASASLVLLSACSKTTDTKMPAGDAMMSSSSSEMMQQAPADAMMSSSSSEGEDATKTSVKEAGDAMIEVK